MISWPEVIPKLRALHEHWQRRLQRLELLAVGGGSWKRSKVDGKAVYRVGGHVDWTRGFPERRAYLLGQRDAIAETLQVLDDHVVPLEGADATVLALARQGLDAETIAARCGWSVREVAEALARFAQASEPAPPPGPSQHAAEGEGEVVFAPMVWSGRN